MNRRLNLFPTMLFVSAMMMLAAPIIASEPEKPAENKPAYGKTPDAVAPYRDFQEPYLRLFLTKREFLGTGRDDTPAEPPRSARIGFFGPAGAAPDADLGQQMLDGVKLAIEQANATGGYKGIPFELIVRADIGLWGAAASEMAAFKYEDNVLAVMGSIDGANTHVALRALLKLEMSMVNTGSTDPTMTETNIPWLLRCMADDRQQGYALADHVFNECGIQRVVAFRVNDRFGRTGIGKFRDAASRLKHPFQMELRWNRGDRDFGPQLDRIAEANPEALVLWGNASDMAAVVREIRKRNIIDTTTGSSVRIFGCDRMASRAFLAEAGEAAEGVVAVASWDPTRDDPKLATFNKAFEERFNYAPETFAAHAFDGASILIAAIQKAGLNRVRIRDALYEYTHYDGVTGSIDFDATMNDIGPVYIATVKGGQFVFREAALAPHAQGNQGATPYRTLAQSPPTAQSPEQAVAGTHTVNRIGCFLPLDAEGQAAVRGVEMALADAAAQDPQSTPTELLVREVRGKWGDDTSALVDLSFGDDEIVALIGSTERRGTHLAEMIAAKAHFPIITLCADPSVTRIPLPWVFSVAPAGSAFDGAFAGRYRERYGADPGTHGALGYDAGTLIAAQLRAGSDSRLEVRNGLASGAWYAGVSGTFRFDALGNRVDRPQLVPDNRTDARFSVDSAD